MVVQGILNFYYKVKNEPDPRTKDWLLVREPLWVILLIAGYLFIVFNGPKWMKNREAFGLRKVLLSYNALLVALSGWMVYGYYAYTFHNPNFNIYCEKIKPEDRSEPRMKLLNVAWWYFFSKVIEFGDTFFFILRKKNNQISFLHVYHHCSMLFLEWCVIRYIPDGVSYFGAMLNSFIHVLMYGYYLLAALGPHMQKYLWWKRYLTRLQMIQFVTIFIHNSYARKLNCGFPRFWHEAQFIAVFIHNSYAMKLECHSRAWHWVLWVYMVSLYALFSHFYNRAYTDKKSKVKDEEAPDRLKVN